MSLFFWRKKKTRNQARRPAPVDRQAALAARRQLPEFRRLQQAIGAHSAGMIRMCDEYVQRAVQWQDWEGEEDELFIPMVSGYFDYELRMIRDIQGQILELWGRCDNCELRDLLDRNNLDPNQWRIPTNPIEDDLWKGVNWVNSHDPSMEKRRRTLRLMMILQRDYDPRTKRAFDLANVELIGLDAAMQDRMTNRGGPYPSSVGAQALADGIEGLATTLNLVPGSGDRKWDDLACFLYGAYVRAQSAPDGNKRSSRAIFIATLRKGGRPIRVPNHALDCILQGPNFAR